MQVWDCGKYTAVGHSTHAVAPPRHPCASGKDMPLRLAEGALDTVPQGVAEPEVDA